MALPLKNPIIYSFYLYFITIIGPPLNMSIAFLCEKEIAHHGKQQYDKTFEFQSTGIIYSICFSPCRIKLSQVKLSKIFITTSVMQFL